MVFQGVSAGLQVVSQAGHHINPQKLLRVRRIWTEGGDVGAGGKRGGKSQPTFTCSAGEVAQLAVAESLWGEVLFHCEKADKFGDWGHSGSEC